MHTDQFVFSQLTSFLDRNHFNYLVRKYNGNHYVKHLTCWNQLLALMFGQLSNRESLRDLILVMEAHRSKSFHLGFGRKPIAKTTLAKANQQRNYRIFEEFAFYMMEQAQRKRAVDIFKLDGHVYAFDSTTIPLCLSVFWWARYRHDKGGVKAHVLYDVEAQVPAFFHITEAAVNDARAMSEIPYESGAYYVFDRGYNALKQLFRIHQCGSFFVVRAKGNLKYRIVENAPRTRRNIREDQRILLHEINSFHNYPDALRLVRYHDTDQKRDYVFLTNAFHLDALEVANLYKNRWQIELFFKWLKQHLKIKRFWGTTENAVRIQISAAIIAYCLVAIVQHDLHIERSTYEVLQILSVSLTDKTPLRQLFERAKFDTAEEQIPPLWPQFFP